MSNTPISAKELHYMAKPELHLYKRDVHTWPIKEQRWAETDRIQERLLEL